MPKPQNHYYHVDMALSDIENKNVVVKMPVWTPGSYLVREFAKNVNRVTAKGKNGKKLPIKKITKNAWEITAGKQEEITVSYDVYAFELTVRTSFLDLTHGFVSGTGVFMYTDATKNKSGNLSIVPHKSFSTITTALPKGGEGVVNEGQTFSFKNYDQLVDCPIEIGNQEVFKFNAAGVEHTVALYGKGNYTISKLKKDMAKVIEGETSVFGQNPNKKYTFIIHNVLHGQGGLEHVNSTTLSVNRNTYEGDDYIGFLSLVAHEYFHLWNVKRIRPKALGPFNYDEENYTSLLWVMEGFTSYYDELMLLRTGYYDRNDYLNKLLGTINYVEGSVGTRVQPVAHASFDAWIKAYRPNENSRNTTMSYYSRGAMLAALIDAKIIKKFNGKKCLDHFLRVLYKNYHEELNRGFTEEEFQAELEEFLDEDLNDFFANYVYETKTPDFHNYFSAIGLGVEYTGRKEVSFGAQLSQSGGKLTVRGIRSNSSAENGGLSVNDEIIACNGFRTNKTKFEEYISTLEKGNEMELLVSRDEVLHTINITMGEYERPSFNFFLTGGKEEENLMNYWLRTLD